MFLFSQLINFSFRTRMRFSTGFSFTVQKMENSQFQLHWPGKKQADSSNSNLAKSLKSTKTVFCGWNPTLIQRMFFAKIYRFFNFNFSNYFNKVRPSNFKIRFLSVIITCQYDLSNLNFRAFQNNKHGKTKGNFYAPLVLT
jgi:hypothetical protein